MKTSTMPTCTVAIILLILNSLINKSSGRGFATYLSAEARGDRSLAQFLRNSNPDSWEEDFERFLWRTGGVVNPSRNLSPKQIEGFHPSSVISSILRYPQGRTEAATPSDYLDSLTGAQKKSKTLPTTQRKGKSRHLTKTPYKGPPGGCVDSSGFHFEGETWYTRGCRRQKCLHFKGTYFVETDSCDTEIYNTTYKCIVQADLEANYPKCCPKYDCNPDNLGNRDSNIQSGV